MKNEDIGAGINKRESLRIKGPDGTYRTVREQIVEGSKGLCAIAKTVLSVTRAPQCIVITNALPALLAPQGDHLFAFVPATHRAAIYQATDPATQPSA